MTLLEARERGPQVAAEQTDGPWTFDRVYLRDDEWIAVLSREPTPDDAVAAFLAGRHDLAGRMMPAGAPFVADDHVQATVTRHISVGRP